MTEKNKIKLSVSENDLELFNSLTGENVRVWLIYKIH